MHGSRNPALTGVSSVAAGASTAGRYWPTHMHYSVNILFVQLARYDYIRGVAVKNSQPLAIPSRVTMPIFGQGIRGFKAVYHVAAILVHHGPHTRTGRYAAILCSDELDARGRCWETNDGRKAKLCDAQLTYAQQRPRHRGSDQAMLILQPWGDHDLQTDSSSLRRTKLAGIRAGAHSGSKTEVRRKVPGTESHRCWDA